MVKDTIIKWIMDEGLAMKKIPDNESNFNYLVDLILGVSVHVVQGKNDPPDRINLAGGYQLQPNDISCLDNLGEFAKSHILWDLKMELNKMGVEFSMIGENGIQDGKNPRKIMLGVKYWHRDDLKWKFMERVNLFQQGLVMVSWTFHRLREDKIRYNYLEA